MDDNGYPPPARTYEQVVTDLLNQLRQRQTEWIAASEQDREAARQQFIEALRAFNGVVLYGDVRRDR